MTNPQDKLIQFAKQADVHPNLPIADELSQVNENLKNLKVEVVNKPSDLATAFFSLLKGEKGDEPSDEKLKELITPLIPDPIKGDVGERGADSTIAGKDGKDGYTPIKGKDYFDGEKGFTGEKGDIGLSGKDADEEAIIAKIRKNIGIEDIKNLKGHIDKFTEYMQKPSMASIAGRDLVKDIDISASLNGVTTTFNIQAIWNVISVSLSSYPYGTLRKNIDYSFTPTSITFLSTIDPTTQLSTGQQCILTVVQS